MASYTVNKVILIGRLTRDPELRYTAKGTAVCNFGLATSRSWTTPEGETREDTEFHNIVAWAKLAEISGQILSKGRKTYISGRLQTRDWTGDDKIKRYRTEIIADEMIVLDSAPQKSSTQKQQAQTDQIKEEKSDNGKQADKPAGEEESEDKKDQSKQDVNPDDIPF